MKQPPEIELSSSSLGNKPKGRWAMRSHIDDAIAFNYPPDFLLSDRIEGEYFLERGDSSVFIRRLNDDVDWRLSTAEASRVPKMPAHDVVRGRTGIPGGQMWTQDYRQHGFTGKLKTFRHYNISNEFSGKAMMATVERGGHRIEVRVQDLEDFPFMSRAATAAFRLVFAWMVRGTRNTGSASVWLARASKRWAQTRSRSFPT